MNETPPSVVGASVPDESAALHVTGAAQFVDDLPVPAGTLHVALALSPIARGVVKPRNVDAVAARPGVVAVLGGRDIPGHNDCGTILHDEPVLVCDEVAYLGQPVLAVVATDRDSAVQAAAAVEFDCDEMPARFDVRAAHEAGEHVLPPMLMSRPAPGEVRAALDAAPQRLRGTFGVGGQEHFYLETHVALAVPGDDGSMLVRCSTQNPSEVQRMVAECLDVPDHLVRVECRRLGGGFGGKEAQPGLFACVAALAAYRTGRPVKLRLDRQQDDVVTGKRHPFEYDYDVGHDDEGRLLAYEVDLISDAGHSADLSGPVMTRAMCHVDNAYWLPYVTIHGYPTRTNRQSSTAFRGFGGPQGALVTEYVIDTVARRLGRDPLDVRLLNLYGDNGSVTPYGEVVEDNQLRAVIEEVERSSDYRARRREIESFNAGSPVLKRGIALTPVKFGISFNVSYFNQAGALVHVYLDGSVLVNHSATEMGQGVNTKVRQVVAAELGVPLERVRSTATDTEKVANTSATAASTGSDMNGKAAQTAARRVRERLAVVAAELLDGDPDQVRFAAGEVRLGDAALPFAEVVSAAYVRRVQLWSDGFYATPDLHWDMATLTGRPFHYFCLGAAASEVVVDTLTGESRVLRADLLYDAGRSLNPAVDLGQVEGAFLQGVGWLTTEELRWDDATGRLLTLAPTTYKVPAVHDVPLDLRARLYQRPATADTIHRSKAVGEPPLLLAFSAFLAIRDAIHAVAPQGPPPPLRAPATAEEVLRSIAAVT